MIFNDNFLNVAFSLEMGIFGITITIFTVLYSFILSKKSELSFLTQQHNSLEYSSIIESKITFVQSYLKKLKRINNHLFFLFISAFILSVVSYVFILLSINSIIVPCFVLCLLFLFCGLSLIYILILLFFIGKQYYIDVKI